MQLFAITNTIIQIYNLVTKEVKSLFPFRLFILRNETSLHTHQKRLFILIRDVSSYLSEMSVHHHQRLLFILIKDISLHKDPFYLPVFIFSNCKLLNTQQIRQMVRAFDGSAPPRMMVHMV